MGLMKKMRRIRQQFKIAAWEQRERYDLDKEEAYMRNFLELEFENEERKRMTTEEEYLVKTYAGLKKMEATEREKMATAEEEMHFFIKEEKRVERENELKSNADMITEEAYIRETYEQLAIMEENERTLMRRDEW